MNEKRLLKLAKRQLRPNSPKMKRIFRLPMPNTSGVLKMSKWNRQKPAAIKEVASTLIG